MRRQISCRWQPVEPSIQVKLLSELALTSGIFNWRHGQDKHATCKHVYISNNINIHVYISMHTHTCIHTSRNRSLACFGCNCAESSSGRAAQDANTTSFLKGTSRHTVTPFLARLHELVVAACLSLTGRGWEFYLCSGRHNRSTTKLETWINGQKRYRNSMEWYAAHRLKPAAFLSLAVVAVASAAAE